MQTSFDHVKDSSLSLFFVLLLVTIPFVWSVLPHNVLVLVLLMLMYFVYDCAYGHCVKRKEEEGDDVQCAWMGEPRRARGSRDIYVKVLPSMSVDSDSAKYTEVIAYRTFLYSSLRHGTLSLTVSHPNLTST
jgi:hypothetical protein